jgi:hypothetical protein
MGESKRRKKLDPNYGKKYKFANLSGYQNKSLESLSFEQFDSSEENKFDLVDVDYEDDNFDSEDKDKNLIRFNVSFQYEAQGKTPDGKSVSQSGEMKLTRQLEADQYDDDGIIFGEALQSAMEDFYIFEFEKQGHSEVSEVTISIKNLKIDE